MKFKPTEMWAIVSKETGKILQGYIVTHLYNTPEEAMLLNRNEDYVIPVLIVERPVKKVK